MNRKYKNLLFSTFLFVFGFLLCRFTFFGAHGMKQFPFILFLFGLGILAIATLCNFQIVSMLNAPGYIISFVPAIVFGKKCGSNRSYDIEQYLDHLDRRLCIHHFDRHCCRSVETI